MADTKFTSDFSGGNSDQISTTNFCTGLFLVNYSLVLRIACTIFKTLLPFSVPPMARDSNKNLHIIYLNLFFKLTDLGTT